MSCCYVTCSEYPGGSSDAFETLEKSLGEIRRPDQTIIEAIKGLKRELDVVDTASARAWLMAIPRYNCSRGMKRSSKSNDKRKYAPRMFMIDGSRDVYSWAFVGDERSSSHGSHPFLDLENIPPRPPQAILGYKERAQPTTATTTTSAPAPSLAKHARRTCSDRSCRPDRRDNSAQPQLLSAPRICESHETPPRSSSTRVPLDLQSEHSSRTS